MISNHSTKIQEHSYGKPVQNKLMLLSYSVIHKLLLLHSQKQLIIFLIQVGFQIYSIQTCFNKLQKNLESKPLKMELKTLEIQFYVISFKKFEKRFISVLPFHLLVDLSVIIVYNSQLLSIVVQLIGLINGLKLLYKKLL